MIRRVRTHLANLGAGLGSIVQHHLDETDASLALMQVGWRDVNRPPADDIRDLAQAWADEMVDAERLRDVLYHHGIEPPPPRKDSR